MSDLRLFDDLDRELRNKKLVLYGASGTGVRILKKLSYIDIHPYAFCDGNSAKWGGGKIKGLPVISPEKLYSMSKQEPEEVRVIICSVYLSDIYHQLVDKICDYQIYSAFSLELALKFYVHRNDAICSSDFKEKTVLIEKVWSTPERENSYRFDNNLDKKRLLCLLEAEKEIALAFSHGKCGTRSIFSSLENHFFSLHFHDLEMWFGQSGYLSSSPTLWHEVMEHFKIQKKRIKIICGVREPISRDISGFFQTLIAYNNMLIEDYHISFLENVCEFLKQETTRICSCVPKTYREYGLCNLEYGRNFDWFNLELKKYFNIDIWKTNFDKDKGYQIYQQDNVEVFVYELEKLMQLEAVLGEFLGVPDFQIISKNKGEDKEYWKLYQDTKKEIILPKQYVNFYYNDNFGMNYFYTKEEQDKFLLKWKGNIHNIKNNEFK